MRFSVAVCLALAAVAGMSSPAQAQVKSLTVGLHSSCPYGPVG
jgi:hypothetical protein